MPGSTGFGFTGIGKETTKGTSVAAVMGIPVTRADGDDATDVLPDQGMRGSMATMYGAVKGTTSATYDIEGNVHLDSFGYFLGGIFGADATTGAGPFTHVFSLLNSGTGQGPSYTIHDYQGLQARKYAASTLSSLTFRVHAQELLTYSASFTSFSSVTETTTIPSFGALDPLPGWNGVATIGGSVNALVEECEITFSRNVSVVQTVDGTTDPLQIWQGPLSISGRLMFVADAEVEFLKYLSVTDGGSPDGQVPLQLAFTQAPSSLTVLMSRVVYNSAKVERGEDFTQVSAQFDAIATTTDAGASGGFAPAKVTLINAIAGSTYV